MFVVDTNAAEDFVAEALLDAGQTVVRRHLDVGDVLIQTENGTEFVVERKTWADLAASICDGRWRDQKARMHAADGNPNAIYAYLIEGPIPNWNAMVGRMHARALFGAVVKTQLRDQLSVFHTCDKQSTCDLLLYLHAQVAAGIVDSSPLHTQLPGVRKRKRDNLSSPAQVYRSMLCIIPGMSAEKADVVVAKYATLHSLVTTADVGVIAALQCKSRRLGPALAARIVASVAAPDSN